jgi:hypothetical protein
MAVKLNETDDGKVAEIQVSGKLTHEDYELGKSHWKMGALDIPFDRTLPGRKDSRPLVQSGLLFYQEFLNHNP